MGVTSISSYLIGAMKLAAFLCFLAVVVSEVHGGYGSYGYGGYGYGGLFSGLYGGFGPFLGYGGGLFGGLPYFGFGGYGGKGGYGYGGKGGYGYGGIMEGSYNKVLLAKDNVPAESFKYFIDILLNTVRDEIASCLEKAYPDMSCADAARMLSIPQGELAKYGADRNWSVTGTRLEWQPLKGEEEGGVPSLQLANMAISYAKEMEQIV